MRALKVIVKRDTECMILFLTNSFPEHSSLVKNVIGTVKCTKLGRYS